MGTMYNFLYGKDKHRIMADDLKENVAVENENSSESTENEKKVTKTYTEDEVKQLVQSESDRRISQYQKTLEKRNREATRLSKMSESERYEYELSERERQIEEKERELTLAENRNAVAKILSEKNISLSFVDFCVDEDADKMKEKIKILDTEFKKSVKAEVEKRLASNVPKRALNTDETITLEQFKKMSISQQSELYNEQPELYKALVSQFKK